MKVAFVFLSLIALASARNAFGNHVAVANRAGGSVSIVNPNTLQPVTFPLPDNGEPMYIAPIYRMFGNKPAELWVGDRANNRLVILALRGNKIQLAGTVPTPAGPFHSLTSQRLRAARPLVFTACDIDNVVAVNDVRSRQRLCVMKMPQMVVAAGGKPHDVTSDGRFAYVTFLGTNDGSGFVASYVARTCKLISVIKTAQDPHVSIRPGTALYIAAQGGEVLSRSVPRLQPLTRTVLPSPHGIFMSFNKRFLYVTNIAEGGTNAVVVFRVRDGKKLNCPQINASFPTPHNPTLALGNNKLYISHSIPDDNVNTAWNVNSRTGCVDPKSERVFKTGLNPFGIATVPRV